MLEQLGGPDERVSPPSRAAELTSAAAADLCLLAVVAAAGDQAVSGRVPGLPDERVRQRRAADPAGAAGAGPGGAPAVARAQLLWDVGAGSGSIGIEWMRADPLARAIAVEARPDRAARVAGNAAALGVPGLRVVTGSRAGRAGRTARRRTRCSSAAG